MIWSIVRLLLSMTSLDGSEKDINFCKANTQVTNLSLPLNRTQAASCPLTMADESDSNDIKKYIYKHSRILKRFEAPTPTHTKAFGEAVNLWMRTFREPCGSLRRFLHHDYKHS